MKINRVPILKSDDKIMIIAPADSFKTKGLTAKKRLEEEFGVIIEFSKHSQDDSNLAGTTIAQFRAEDIHTAFKDNSVKAILAATGGYSSNDILPYLDWELIKRNSKPFIGSSDITVLINAINAKTGMITYFGPNLYKFGMKLGLEYTLKYLKKSLFSSEDTYFVEPSKQWSDDKWWLDQDDRTFYKTNKYIICNNGVATGKIVGGNLCSLNLLQGTEYMPDITNAIFFVEDDDLPGEWTFGEFCRNIQSLLQLPQAQSIKGIVFGRFKKLSKMNSKKINYIVNTIPLLQKIPVIANVDFGHTDPCITFPIGGVATIDTSNINENILSINTSSF